jgi:carbon-monoxide dehydrogenase small subunit
MKIQLQINGIQHELDVSPLRRLIDVLREDLGLTGAKEGCGEGECGTCMVLVDGAPVNACLIPVGQLQQRSVRTIEGLAGDPLAEHIIETMVRRGAVQCGFCTPGIVITTYALLQQTGRPTAEQARRALAGNICRCTGYAKIIDAVVAAAEEDSQP